MKMKSFISLLLVITGFLQPTLAQKKGLKTIDQSDLKAHMDFIASDELEGRATGEAGLDVAARYLAVQAAKLGLKPAGENGDYFQHYALSERSYLNEESSISIIDAEGNVSVDPHSFFVLPSPVKDTTEIEGEVVFAGYGIYEPDLEYNDFEGIDIQGKVVLIMDRAPMNEDGTESQFGEKWLGMQNFQNKLQFMMMRQPKAILLVFDPKSGNNSIEDINPAIAGYLSKSISMKKDEPAPTQELPGPKIVLIHRSVADAILDEAGESLEEIQEEIDTSLEPRSFDVEDTRVNITLTMKNEDHDVPNVFGYIEGSDPELKDEFVFYLAHFDHVGTGENGEVFNGADDNASGTVALLEIAEAWMAEKKAPARSVGFLWVSGEEIGLYGSRYFSEHPLIPLEDIAAVINLDMVGRVKTPEDVESEREALTIVSRDSVKVIGGLQSNVLMQINEETLDEMGLYPNYTYNTPDHPERYFYRSDHINFARHDIPVLFYSTGTHRDYHLETDDPDRIDYEKFRKMTEFAFLVGYNIAGYKGEITVDNPMSEW